MHRSLCILNFNTVLCASYNPCTVHSPNWEKAFSYLDPLLILGRHFKIITPNQKKTVFTCYCALENNTRKVLILKMDHVVLFPYAAFIIGLFFTVKNNKTFSLLGPFNPHVVQLLKMDHMAHFWFAAFTLESYPSEKNIRQQYCAAKNLLAHMTLFQKRTRVFT